MDHGVIDGPISMEVEHFFVPLGSRLHLHVRLVSDNMVNGLEHRWLDEGIEWFVKVGFLEPWKERSSIINVLNKCMNSITISLNSGNNDGSILVLHLFGLRNRFGSSCDSLGVHGSAVFNFEGDIMDSVSVLFNVRVELSLSRVKRGLESVEDVSVRDNMSAEIAGSGLEALIGVEGESHSRSVEGCGLLCVTNVEEGVVESDEFTNVRLCVRPQSILLFQ